MVPLKPSKMTNFLPMISESHPQIMLPAKFPMKKALPKYPDILPIGVGTEKIIMSTYICRITKAL